MKKRIIPLIASVMVLAIGTTYAIYTWAVSERISGTSECLEINYTKGQDIGSDNEHKILMPTSDYVGGLAATVIVGVKSHCTLTGNGKLYLTTDDTTTNALLESGALKYQIIQGSSTKIADGVINQKGTITIAENLSITTTTKQYTVYVWLDGEFVTNENVNTIVTSIYKGKISMEIRNSVE